MRKLHALLLAALFLTSSLIIIGNPVSGATSQENTWIERAPMQQARSYLSTISFNEKIYAIGGNTQSGNPPYSGGIVGTNEEYNPATNKWVFKASMPTPRYEFAIAVFDNKIYCIGGNNGNGATNVTEVYNPTTDTWTTKKPMPTARDQLKANVVDGKIYLIGGYDPDTSGYYSTLNEVYDPTTDSWTTKESIPTATIEYASAVIDNKIYIIGGHSGSLMSYTPELNQIYDTSADNWSNGTPLSGVIGVAASTTGELATKRIYVFGKDSTNIYDDENDRWSFGVSMPTKRSSFSVAAVKDLIYVIGGATSTNPDGSEQIPFSNVAPTIRKYATNEMYTPIGYGTPNSSNSQTTESPSPSIPEFASWIIFQPLIILVTVSILLVYFKKHKTKTD